MRPSFDFLRSFVSVEMNAFFPGQCAETSEEKRLFELVSCKISVVVAFSTNEQTLQ